MVRQRPWPLQGTPGTTAKTARVRQGRVRRGRAGQGRVRQGKVGQSLTPLAWACHALAGGSLEAGEAVAHAAASIAEPCAGALGGPVAPGVGPSHAHGTVALAAVCRRPAAVALALAPLVALTMPRALVGTGSRGTTGQQPPARHHQPHAASASHWARAVSNCNWGTCPQSPPGCRCCAIREI